MTQTHSLSPFDANMLETVMASAVDVHTASSLNKARAAGSHRALIRELDHLAPVPHARFINKAATASSEAKPLELVAMYRKETLAGAAGAAIDLSWAGEAICRIKPGEVARFWVAEPERTFYAMPDGSRVEKLPGSEPAQLNP